MFITDLDGTLLRTDRTFSEKDIDSLKKLKDEEFLITIATGRSYYSFERVLTPDLCLDYLVFSTGAGIMDISTGNILRAEHLNSEQISRSVNLLYEAKLDFMIHGPIPENHRFLYNLSSAENPDFHKRIELYREFCKPIESSCSLPFSEATQLLAILPQGRDRSIISELRHKLPDFNIISTTSPLDEESQWLEFFPAHISKSQSVEWLTQRLGIDRRNTASIGNDFNDLDLLHWSDNSYVVENAPEYLKERFMNVSSNNSNGISEAIGNWLEKQIS